MWPCCQPHCCSFTFPYTCVFPLLYSYSFCCWHDPLCILVYSFLVLLCSLCLSISWFPWCFMSCLPSLPAPLIGVHVPPFSFAGDTLQLGSARLYVLRFLLGQRPCEDRIWPYCASPACKERRSTPLPMLNGTMNPQMGLETDRLYVFCILYTLFVILTCLFEIYEAISPMCLVGKMLFRTGLVCDVA